MLKVRGMQRINVSAFSELLQGIPPFVDHCAVQTQNSGANTIRTTQRQRAEQCRVQLWDSHDSLATNSPRSRRLNAAPAQSRAFAIVVTSPAGLDLGADGRQWS